MPTTFAEYAADPLSEPLVVLSISFGSTTLLWGDEDYGPEEAVGAGATIDPRILAWSETFRAVGDRGMPELSDIVIEVNNSDGGLDTYLTDFDTINNNMAHCTAILLLGFRGLAAANWAQLDKFSRLEFTRGDNNSRLEFRLVQNVVLLFGEIRHVPHVWNIEGQLDFDGSVGEDVLALPVPIVYGNFSNRNVELPTIPLSQDCVQVSTGSRGTYYLVCLHKFDADDEPTGFETYMINGEGGRVVEGTSTDQVSFQWEMVTFNGNAYKALTAFWREVRTAATNTANGGTGAPRALGTAPGHMPTTWVGVHIKAGYDTGGGSYSDDGSPTEVVTAVGICESLVKHFSDGTWSSAEVNTSALEVVRSKLKRDALGTNWLLDGPKRSALEECVAVLSSMGVAPFVNRNGELDAYYLNPTVDDVATGFTSVLDFNDDDERNVIGFREHWPTNGERYAVANMLDYSYGGRLRDIVLGRISRHNDHNYIERNESVWFDVASVGHTRPLEISTEMQSSIDKFGPVYGRAMDFPGTVLPAIAKKLARNYVATLLAPRPTYEFSTDDLRIAEYDIGDVVKVKSADSISAQTTQLCMIEGLGFDPSFKTFRLRVVNFDDVLTGRFFRLGNETDWYLDTGTTMDLTQSGADVAVHFDAVPTDDVVMSAELDWHIVVTSSNNSIVLKVTARTDSQNYTAAAQSLPGANDINLVEGTDYQCQHSYASAKGSGTTGTDSEAKSQALTVWGHLADSADDQMEGGDAGYWLADEP